MLPDYPSSRRNTPLPILVIEDNKDHQLLIAHCVQTQMTWVKPFIVDNAEQALAFLSQTAVESDKFPRLVLLDLHLPEPGQGWQLLTKLRSGYPRLPIVMLSNHHGIDIVSKAYELGVSSFIEKPVGLENWEYFFQVFAQYWLNIIS